MIRKNGPRKWTNVHVTATTQLDQLIDIDNSVPNGPEPPAFELLRRAARDLDAMIQEVRDQGKRMRGLGSGWALSDIAITDGWLINTKLLNGCFELGDHLFHPEYPSAKRPFLVLAQCGMSVAELNGYLEVTAPAELPRRALKTAGIGAGQTIAGAISGNTHGSAINFGSMSDYVVGLHIVTGQGRRLWIERASAPALNEAFLNRLDATLIRDDDVFDAAVVSFGAFGIIAAVALETDPVYHLDFAPVQEITVEDLRHKLNNFDFNSPNGLYHYEFVFDPYSGKAMEALAPRVPYSSEVPTPTPVWIIRNSNGLAPGDQAAKAFFALPLPPSAKTAFQFAQYRKSCILDAVKGTPGQVFTATITYLEGYTESALGISMTDAAQMIEISSEVIRQMGIPTISQARAVHPSRALLSFTHLGPKTVVFEFGLAHNAQVAVFEQKLTDKLNAAGIPYTFHWSKNAGLDAQRVHTMYGETRINKWREARKRVFQNDSSLMRVFENQQLIRAGLS